MKTITTNFLIVVMVLLGHCSLSSMQPIEGQYEQFLEQRKEINHAEKSFGVDKFFNFKEELKNGFILKTRVSLYMVEGESQLFGIKEIINPQLNRDRGLIATLDYVVYDKKSSEQCECLIKYLETNKLHQKQGYATQLLVNLESELKQAGCSKITLESVINKIDFYTKRGFIPTEKIGAVKKSIQLEMYKELNG